MPSRLLAGEQVRRNFGKIPKIIAFPNLVEMQKESYARFLQKDVPPEKRRTEGLQGVRLLWSLCPIALEKSSMTSPNAPTRR